MLSTRLALSAVSRRVAGVRHGSARRLPFSSFSSTPRFVKPSFTARHYATPPGGNSGLGGGGGGGGGMFSFGQQHQKGDALKEYVRSQSKSFILTDR